MSLCLIHTADLHGRLSMAKARRLRTLSEERHALLLDSGDALFSPNLFAYPWRESSVAAMNAAAYDAMCLGNREYGLCQWSLRRKLGGFAFPVLAANVVVQKGRYANLLRWTVLQTAEGQRVGVFGLAQRLLPAGSVWERTAAARHVEPLAAAREAVAALRAEVDVLVALTHYGEKPEAELAAALPEIDAIICGHWHVNQASLEYAGKTAISRTVSHARGAAMLTLEDGRWQQEEVAL